MSTDNDQTDNGKLPTVNEIAADIYTSVHNSSQKVRITDDEFREVSGREKVREGLKKGVWDRLEELGCAVQSNGSVVTVSIPEENTISLREAKERSKEAQETGWRTTIDGESNDVIHSGGSAKSETK